MQPPPTELAGAKLTRFASLRDIQPSKRFLVLFDGVPISPPSGVAIGQYEGEDGFYLFHCSGDWTVLGAGYYASLQATLASAEHAYPGVSGRWAEGG
jgi:hypothetical protein